MKEGCTRSESGTPRRANSQPMTPQIGVIVSCFNEFFASAIRQQRGHDATAVMGDPDLLQELPHIPALLPEGGRGWSPT